MIFKTKCLCVNAGFAEQEDEQPTKVVRKENEDTRVSQRGT